MKPAEIISAVRIELKKYVDIAYRDGIGVRLPDRRKIAQQLWPQVKLLSKKERWQLIETMLSGLSEEVTIGLDWLWCSRTLFDNTDMAIFDRWLKQYIYNWAMCDDFCTHSVGYLINQFPALARKIFDWARSTNRWCRRAAAVSLIYPWGKPKQFLPQIFQTALALLTDQDDLVQKGYGWMLKEASNYNQKEVFTFVMKHKTKMPRTALRYAIEKFPRKLKRQAIRLTP